MYRCCDCGLEFNRPKKFVETHGLDTPPYEVYYGCPNCEGPFDEVEELEEDEDEEE